MKKIIWGMAVCLLLFACEQTEDPAPASMTVSKDGTSFTVTSFNNTLVKESQLGNPGRRLDLRGEVDGGFLVLSVSNWDWQNPTENGILLKSYDTNTDYIDNPGTHSVCEETPSFTMCDGALLTYIVGNDQWMSENMDPIYNGTITITQNDDANKTVSGNFDGTVKSFFGEEYIEFSGSFTNLTYQ